MRRYTPKPCNDGVIVESFVDFPGVDGLETFDLYLRPKGGKMPWLAFKLQARPDAPHKCAYWLGYHATGRHYNRLPDPRRLEAYRPALYASVTTAINTLLDTYGGALFDPATTYEPGVYYGPEPESPITPVDESPIGDTGDSTPEARGAQPLCPLSGPLSIIGAGDSGAGDADLDLLGDETDDTGEDLI